MQRKRCQDGRDIQEVFPVRRDECAEAECRVSRKTYKEPNHILRQKQSVATQRRRETMRHTGVFRIVERRGAEANGCFSKKMLQRAKLLFRQKRYYATQAMSRRTGHTRGISRSARRVRGSRMPFFTEKKIRAFRHMQDPPHRPGRGRYRSARSTPRRRRRTRGCTSARRCVEERSRHPVRWL